MIDISDRRRRAIGEALPGLRLGDVLGRGAGGCVIAGEDGTSGRPVAVKVLADDLLLAPFARERLRIEAEVLTSCRHPNLVEGISFHEYGDMLLLVMERVTSVTVLETQQGPPLTAHQACHIVLAAALALSCVHEHGFLHGDVKPENVLFDPEGRHRLVDFGLARRWPFQRGRHVAGTPGYMPPEAIAAGGVLVPATDVYALGVMAYELLAGQSPFVSGQEPIDATAIPVEAAPIPLRAVVPAAPRRLADLVMAAIEPDVERRLQSAAAFADALAGIMNLEGSLPGTRALKAAGQEA
jgi:serine/threonine-protein kinase